MKLQIVCVLLVVSFKLGAQTCKEIIGYYPNWQWYDRNKLVNPQTIDYSKYSIINYCFFKPEADGHISNTDTWSDENLLQGQINWSTTPVSYYPNTSIIDRAHQAGTKVMVSIGGWTLSDNFPTIAVNSASRAVFASECNRLLQFYHFDGIDIDWEYPGFAEHSGTGNDKQNFTVFMQQIRDSITALGNRNGKNYLLSACFSADPVKAQNIEWNNVPSIVDMINVMSYDYFGAWDCSANHNSPLYAPNSGNNQFNLNSIFQLLTATYNVPSNKINLGVAFYGRSQMGATSLYQTTNCSANTIVFSEDDGTPLYYNTLKHMSLFDTYWDNVAQVPYLLGKPSGSAAGTFLSYDDERSIALKGEYIKNSNARGAIIWEITGDYLETSPGSGVVLSTPLVDTLNAVFCNATVGLKSNNNDSEVLAYPNPSAGSFQLSWSKANVEEVAIFNALGVQIRAFDAKALDGKLVLKLDESGVYTILLKSIDSSKNVKVVVY